MLRVARKVAELPYSCPFNKWPNLESWSNLRINNLWWTETATKLLVMIMNLITRDTTQKLKNLIISPIDNASGGAGGREKNFNYNMLASTRSISVL